MEPTQHATGERLAGLTGDLPSLPDDRRAATPRRTPDGWRGADGDLSHPIEERWARGLGLFSLGLGLAEVLAPERMARLAGASEEHSAVVRMLGMREIAHGVAILSQARPAAGVWSRVGGDLLDVAAALAAFGSPEASRGRLTLTTVALAGIGALDLMVAQTLSAPPSKMTADGIRHVVVNVTIGKPAGEIYAFWRRLDTLPLFMHHLVSVDDLGGGRPRWVALGPGGVKVEWEAEITADVPDQQIAWRSTGDADVYNAGSVSFVPAGDRGTRVTVRLDYKPKGGALGVAAAAVMRKEPAQMVHDDLRRLKQIFEVGEVVRSEGTLRGNGLLEQRPARSTEGR